MEFDLNQGLFELTTENIMTSALFTLSPTDTVADALSLMHSKEVRNLPVVDKSGAQTRRVSGEEFDGTAELALGQEDLSNIGRYRDDSD